MSLPKLTNIRIIHKGTIWMCKFQMGTRNLSVDISRGYKPPIGNQLLDAMKEFIDNKQVSTDELFSAPIEHWRT